MSEVTETVHLNDKAKVEYKRYGIHTIEDRAIFGEIDGLKPVARRLVWAAHKMGLRNSGKFTKAAKVIGETMGNFHPHGDQAIAGALVTSVNQTIPLFDGSGNWGTMTDPAAAPRYIECKLSKYSDRVFLDSFYLPINYTVPNYDDSTQEPLILPALLPNALLNGNFGIAPGVRTQTPTFTLKSLSKVIIKSLQKGGCTPKICMGLEFTTELGGTLNIENPANKRELVPFYKTGKGRFNFSSGYIEEKNGIRINRFAPISNIEGIINKISDMPGVKRIRDDSSIKDKYNAYFVEFNKSLKGSDKEAVIAKVMEAFSANVSFNVQVTKREPDGNGGSTKRLSPTSVPEMINNWIAYRIDIEKKACKYWTDKRRSEIAHLELLRLAVANRRMIIQALDKNIDDEKLAKYIAKKLKITVEQANTILDLKIRQLKALEDKKLVAKIKELNKEIKGYKLRISNPKTFIAKHVIDLYKQLK
jgi:DNA gyrase subunit A